MNEMDQQIPSDESNEIHIRRWGVDFGRFSKAQVECQLTNGTLLPADLAWAPGFANWIPLSDLIESATAPSLDSQEHLALAQAQTEDFGYAEFKTQFGDPFAHVPATLRCLFWFFAVIVIIGLLNLILGKEPFGEVRNTVVDQNAHEIRGGLKAFDPTIQLSPADERLIRATAEAMSQ